MHTMSWRSLHIDAMPYSHKIFKHHADFQNKLKKQFQENFQTEGQADLIHGSFLATARVLIREKVN